MKNFIYIFFKTGLLLVFLLATSCEIDYPVVNAPDTIDSGRANFEKVVAIGNSLTAGIQDGYWLGENAANSFPALIVQQMGKTVGTDNSSDFVYPHIPAPGLGTKLSLLGFDANGTPLLNRESVFALPINSAYDAPYDNLGVPGALAIDVITATDQSTSASNNLLFNVVLRNGASPNFGGTQLEQAISLNPTFVMLWIGNNDILGAALSGNTTPGLPTSPTNIQQIFGAIFNGLKSALPEVKGAVANIPDILSIPYITTVPSFVEVPGVGTVPLVIQKGDGSVGQATANDYILLPASSVIGDTSGTYGPQGVPVGLAPQAPLPNQLVLDAAEVAQLRDAIDSYNAIIADFAEQYDFALVDANQAMRDLASHGLEFGGVEFTAEFITGGVFSLDGVHPNTIGYSIIANLFIEAINAKYGSNIPEVNIREYWLAN